MANLKSTNINGDLTLTGGITLAGQIMRQSTNDDYYLGYGQDTSSITDLNDYISPMTGYIQTDRVSGIGNWPGQNGGKLTILQVSQTDVLQIVNEVSTNNVYIRLGYNISTNPGWYSWRTLADTTYKSISQNTVFQTNVQTFSYLSTIPWYTSGMSTYALVTATPNFCSYNVVVNPDSGSNLSDAPGDYGILQVFAGSVNYRMATFHSVGTGAAIWVYAISGDHSPGTWRQL